MIFSGELWNKIMKFLVDSSMHVFSYQNAEIVYGHNARAKKELINMIEKFNGIRCFEEKKINQGCLESEYFSVYKWDSFK